jgi:hypothetical protein
MLMLLSTLSRHVLISNLFYAEGFSFGIFLKEKVESYLEL